MSMTIGQLRERIASLPDHWQVYVADDSVNDVGCVETDLVYVRDVEAQNFPSHGNCVVVIPHERRSL